LLPSDPENYYRKWDVAPPETLPQLGQAKMVITNFHAFKLRERTPAGRLTKAVLGQDQTGAFTETPAQMVRRVCRELGNKRNIVVINDEAHHCYRRKAEDVSEVRLTGEERQEAERREEEARIWISGLEAVKAKIGIRAVYDLSATPFFLRGSGYDEGTLFPWVVSDFSLIDAIESGIVKVPRVPVADDSMLGELPTYRDLWARIRDTLPRKGRATEATGGDPQLPKELEGALHSLYSNYEKYYRLWESSPVLEGQQPTPPVFIVVCNNTNVSKLVFDYIAGYQKKLADGLEAPVPGNLALFSNIDGDRWLARPNTVLIDSAQLESGEGMAADFKKIAAREIEEFKAEYRARFPGRDTDDLTDEDLLREVMNTVGKPGKLGEQVKCVVSVSMLTEGWDANTVTHILGVRAFGSSAGMVGEMGDVGRFSNPRQVMGYVGLGVRESYTGKSIHRGGITKTGNALVRFLAVEAAHHYRLEPKVGPALKKRQEGISEEIKDIAWKAQTRLHRRFWRLMRQGLPYQKVVVAIARELLGFIWAIARATMAPMVATSESNSAAA
jgi:type III restriction enzyme